MTSYTIIALQEGPCFKELVSSFVSNEFSLQRKLAKAVHICTSISTVPRFGSCTLLRIVVR
jgi:hypothetical protein